MKADPQFVPKPVNNFVDQFGGVGQFGTRITAGRKGRSHKRSPFVVATMNDFGQDWLVKLNGTTPPRD